MQLTNLRADRPYAADVVNARGAQVRVRVPPLETVTIVNIDPLYLNQDKALRHAVFVQRHVAVAFECEEDDLVCFAGRASFGDLRGAQAGQVLAFDGSGRLQVVAAGADGQVLTADSAAPLGVAFQTPSGGAGGGVTTHYVFAAGSVGSTTEARYLAIGDGARIARTTPAPFSLPTAGVLRKVYATQAPGGNGNRVRYVIRRNGVNTALFVELPSSATTAAELAASALFSAGDALDVVVLKPDGGIGASPRNVNVTLEVG